MPEGFAPRFAVEVVFLILLAVGLGLADLRPALIIGVMAAAWVLVSLIEWLAGRAAAAPVSPPWQPPAEAERAAGWDMQEILVPAEERVEYPPEPALEALTTVLPPGEPEVEAKPRRRLLRRRSE